MDETELRAWILQILPDVQSVEADGNYFFFVGDERKLPFATLVTNDLYDQDSALDRRGIYRLNMGVSRESFANVDATDDMTALDRIMPHPQYAQMFWVCVLNPTATSLPQVQRLLAEAHELSRARQAKRES